MKRLVAFLLVCVLAFSSVAALGEEDDSVVFSPSDLLLFADELGYTTTQDWTGNSVARALFSIVVYADYMSNQNASNSDIDIDFKQDSFVFVNADQTSVGFAYSNTKGQYRIILFYPDAKLAAYSRTKTFDFSASTIKAMESIGYTVYTNNLEDLTEVTNILAGE